MEDGVFKPIQEPNNAKGAFQDMDFHRIEAGKVSDIDPSKQSISAVEKESMAIEPNQEELKELNA